MRSSSPVIDRERRRLDANVRNRPTPVTHPAGRTTVEPSLWMRATVSAPDLEAAIRSYPPGFVRVSTWFEPLP